MTDATISVHILQEYRLQTEGAKTKLTALTHKKATLLIHKLKGTACKLLLTLYTALQIHLPNSLKALDTHEGT